MFQHKVVDPVRLSRAGNILLKILSEGGGRMNYSEVYSSPAAAEWVLSKTGFNGEGEAILDAVVRWLESRELVTVVRDESIPADDASAYSIGLSPFAEHIVAKDLCLSVSDPISLSLEVEDEEGNVHVMMAADAAAYCIAAALHGATSQCDYQAGFVLKNDDPERESVYKKRRSLEALAVAFEKEADNLKGRCVSHILVQDVILGAVMGEWVFHFSPILDQAWSYLYHESRRDEMKRIAPGDWIGAFRVLLH